MIRPFAAIAIALVAGCTGPEPRIAAPITSVAEKVAIRYGAVELLDVSLPVYAAEEGISVADAGLISVSDKVLWDDDPTRAVTLTLARHLTEITGARVASEPWPFDSFPDVRVDVRVEQLLATDAGVYVMAGQYFVAPQDGRGRDRANLFSLTAPLPDATPATIAASRATLIGELALLIAREGLR